MQTTFKKIYRIIIHGIYFAEIKSYVIAKYLITLKYEVLLMHL